LCRVLPIADTLRKSIIHNDGNDHNIIVDDNTVMGIIDFGDAVKTCTINEIAIACAYAMLDKTDPIAMGCEILRGYNEGEETLFICLF
jgi:Ser/Thr protein kinase RdoA (MazF antagonist)